MGQIDILPIFLSVLISVIATSVVFILYQYLKKSSYDIQNNRAILDEIRQSYEKQIYILNDKLLQNEERWVDINHLLLKTKSKQDINYNIKLNDFLIANGISNKDLEINPNMIFVLTPFNKIFLDDFLIIKNVCSNVGLSCYRGDEDYFQSDIFAAILKYIVRSRVIIANLNGRNPNVMYELGISQALNKPVILISKAPEKLPIDIKSKRFIIYKNDEDLERKLSNELTRILKDN